MVAAVVEVIPRHRDRAADLARLDQRAQRDHLPPLVPDLEQVDVLDPVAVPTLGLDGDLPVPAEIVEAVDVERAQVHRQRLVHVIERDAQARDLGPVDIQESCGVFERNWVATLVRPGTAWSLRTRSSVCCCKCIQPQAAAVLDDELEPAGDAQARESATRRTRSPRRP